MSVKFYGRVVRIGGIATAISNQIKLINFKGVKRVNVKFDPFDEKADIARNYLFYISSPKINETNPNCVIKTDVICNRERPTISFQLIPQVQEAAKIKTVKIELENLSMLELLTATNQHISALAPKETVSSSLKTKSEKKRASGGRRK
ncbi:CLUMA_CG021246, isoform A [Clunio marinus]|uniref:Large ribosomal subunit protein mL53 n=1 Tax=Clunio marinus TaxID=568069 RepID=A0A1J1J7R1_9DIPT|nr:CLUMA_CG021246, isoform A [Clunio marinus]